MRQKKLMLLGGIRYLLPVIETAHKMGVYVITADYLPDNIAHKFSDEYVNVSIIDREAVLKVAQEKQINGILSFGVDPGVVTAAYVAEKMGLPFPPLASVEILQNKDKFRDFLQSNGFNCPFHYSYERDESPVVGDVLRAPRNLERTKESFHVDFPVIVKPVDAAGSKGCSRVDRIEDLAAAVEYARRESHNGRIIVEQFLEKAYASSDTDSFSINDELVFCSFNCQYFDAQSPNPYTPAAYSWPSEMPDSAQKELRSEIQRLIKLLHLGTSVYNIETRVATDGKPYIMELSPRGGGNRLSEVLKMSTGQDLIANNIRGALDLPLEPMTDPEYKGYWAEIIVHSNKSGTYLTPIGIESTFKKNHVVQVDEWVSPGDRIGNFSGANQAIGTVLLRFESQGDAEKSLKNINRWLDVNVG